MISLGWTYSLDLLRRSGVFELEKDNVNDGHCFVVLGCVSVGVLSVFRVEDELSRVNRKG